LETVLILSGVGGGKEGVAGGAGEARLLTGDGTLIILGACCDEQLLWDCCERICGRGEGAAVTVIRFDSVAAVNSALVGGFWAAGRIICGY